MIFTFNPGQILKLTFLAVLVRTYQGKEVWLPKSQIIMTIGDGIIKIFIPAWLSKARGL